MLKSYIIKLAKVVEEREGACYYGHLFGSILEALQQQECGFQKLEWDLPSRVVA